MHTQRIWGYALCLGLASAGCGGPPTNTTDAATDVATDAAPDAAQDAPPAMDAMDVAPDAGARCPSDVGAALGVTSVDFYWWVGDPAPEPVTLSLRGVPEPCRDLRVSAPWVTLEGAGEQRTARARTEGMAAGLQSTALSLRDSTGAEYATLPVRLRVLDRAPAGSPRRVLVVGYDGARPDALQRANTPVLDFLLRRAVFSFAAGTQTGAPAVSAPGWMSIFTGVDARKHGVSANGIYTSRNAMYPTFVRRAGMAGRRVFVSSAWPEVVDSIVEPGAWVETFVAPDDVSSRRLALVLRSSTADMFFQHLDAPDSLGHFSGFSADNPSYVRAIESCDRNLGLVLDGVIARPSFAREDWLVVLSTDHGGRGMSHGAQDADNQTIWFVAAGASITRTELPPQTAKHMDVAATALQWVGVSIDPAWGLDGVARAGGG